MYFILAIFFIKHFCDIFVKNYKSHNVLNVKFTMLYIFIIRYIHSIFFKSIFLIFYCMLLVFAFFLIGVFIIFTIYYIF